ncbi:MAG: sensor histidine kinase [Coriobacteriia bacterium]|nr:sensor histidine kinase [Coriobacteriia bacterium]
MSILATLTSTSEKRAMLADVALGVGLAVFSWLQASMHPFFLGRGFPIPLPVGGGGGGGERFFRDEASWMTFVLIGLAFLPLIVRRRHPVAVLAVTTVAATLYEVLPNPPSLAMMGVLIALYTLGTLTDRRRLLLWGAGSTALVLLASLPAPNSAAFWGEAVRNLAVMLVAGLLGDATRNRRAYVAEVERRAEEAERNREEDTRRRVDEERLRIARELHDVTAHSLSVIAVQSGVASHVLDTKPEEARRALIAIRQVSRDSLQELRAMLGVLRGSEDEAAPLAPSAGLDRLHDLVRPLEESGLDVAIATEGDLTDVPAIADASAYRIVQEALTNVLRHAGKARVTVTVRREPDALLIDVTDDGPGTLPFEEGHGIAGMRERVSALGGALQAGPLDGGGWRVSARLPMAGRQ